ncbi:tape measure protein [Anabaena minutissima FACHB-250]|nr:tape measure protein [Anabaena minutissima FACHB-250]
MADKKVAINVQLKLDSEAFSRKVEGLSGSFKPIEVPVKLQSLGLNAGIGPLKVKADIDPNTLTPSLTTSLKTAFASVTAKLGEDIGEQVGKSVEKLKPSAFSGIVGAIAAPFQQLATGALEGIGREMSVKLGQGLAKGVEKQVAPVIGSFDLLGEKLITTAAPRLGNTLGGKLAKSLFDKDAVKQAQQDFKQFLTRTVGEADALIATQSQKARDGQRQQQNLGLARQQLGTQLAEFVTTAPGRQQQATQLRGQDTQLTTQQQSAQERVTTAQQALAAKRQQLATKQEQILKQLASQGIKIDDTLKAQVAKQVQSAPETVKELAKLEVEYAKTSQALTSIVKQRQTIQDRIKQLAAPISPIVGQLELLGVKQPEIAAVRQKVANTNTAFDKVVTDLNSGINENIAKIKNLRKDIGFYRQQLQALINDYNFQLNFVGSKQEQAQLLQQVITQKNAIVQQIQQAEKDIADAVSRVEGRQGLRGQTQSKQAAKISETEQEYTAAQVRLASQAMGRKTGGQQTNKGAGEILFPDAFQSPNLKQVRLPNVYRQIVEQVAKLSNTKIRESSIPSLGTDARVPVGGAAYDKTSNKVLLDKAAYEQISKGVIDKQLVENVAHELRHALQFEFGKNIKGTGVNLLQPSEQEAAKLAPRINESVASVVAQGKGKIGDRGREITRKTEADAYTFADRYAQEIYNFVTGVTAPSLKTKLTERQRQLNTAREQTQEQLFLSLTDENKAALEQLTGKQLQAIAKSSGITGTSKKKVAEMRQMLLQQVNPEDLAFRIPVFSKVNPQVQQDAQDLLKLPPDQIRQEVGDTNRYFGQAIKTAAKKGKPDQQQELRLVLDGIAEARKVYASALAQDIDAQTRGLLQAAIATLGKQRIAAQSRLISLNSTTARVSNTQPQSVADLQFAFPEIPKFDLSAETAQTRHSQRKFAQPKPDLSFESAQVRRDLRAEQLKTTVENAKGSGQDAAKLIEQINQQSLQGLISADKATKKVADLTRNEQAKQDKSAQKQQAAIAKSSEASFKQAQQALKQIETQTNQQVAEIEQRTRYKEQQQQRKQSDRLRSYGIDQTAPVDIVEQRPQGKPFSIGGAFNKLRGEFQDFRTSGARKQAQVLGQQAQAILVDLDSQIAIGKASVTESKMLQKQIAENEKRIQQILGKVRAAKEGRVPALTPGDLQRLSGQVQQLAAQVDADKQRVAELQPQIERSKRLQPVAKDLRGATQGSAGIASQRNVSGEDLGRLNQFNQQIRQSLQLLGQTPAGGGGFFADLNLKMPGLLKNVFALVKGFAAFQIVSFVQQQLRQLATEAFNTSMRFQALEQSLKFASGGSQDAAENLAFVYQEVDRLSLPLERSIKAFTGLTAASRGTALEGAQTQKIFTAVAQSARVYNLTAEQTEGALLAVQQMISKGTVNAEELRGQLGERLPGAFQIASRSMGKTTAELSKMLELGQITAEDFLPKFAEQLTSETSGGVTGAAQTSAAAVQRLQNSFTKLNREIGDAISPAITTVLNGLATSLDWTHKNAKLVKTVLAALALTVTIALIPSIAALGTAIWTLATVTFPLAAKAMLAIVAANPVLIASLAALTVGMLVAEDGAKALAGALTGVSETEIKQIDADALLDSKYSKAIAQLSKQIPLTKEQINELTTGLSDQEKRGLNTAKTTGLLTNQLLKAQERAEATAKAQAELNKRLTESELAFKKAKGGAELYATENAKNIAQFKARGQLGEDAIRDREYQAEQQQNLRLSQLYSSRINEIKNLLTESERLRESGKKGLEAKEEIKLNEELISVQKEFNQSQANLANADFNRIKEIRDRRRKDFEEAQSIAENQQKAGLITEEKLLQKRLEIQQQKGEEQLQDIRERRAKLDQADREGLEALAVEESTALSQITEAQKTAFEGRLALSQKRSDQEVAIAGASRSKGLISEAQFNQQQYDIKVKYLDDQLAVTRERAKAIAKTDIDGQNEVKSKEAQILQQRTDARKAFIDAQLAQLEREQQKATDLTTLATKEREIELQKLVNARVLNQEEIQNQTLKVTREGIEENLELERQKIAKLEAFPKYDDPVAEEGRQAQIRQSRIRTSDLQLQLLQNEKAQQEAVHAAYSKLIERATQAINNRATAATQSFNKELLSLSAAEKSLQFQNQLLDAQKSLRSALSGYIDAEFQILKESAKGEREKKQLAETQANIKLQAAKQQAELDKQSLELQILQTEQAQKRLEAENAIAQIKNRADIATKQAELAKVQADPNATPEQKEAARLQVVAAQAEGEGLQQQAGFLIQQRGVDSQVNQMRRQAQEAQSGAAITQAEFEAANNIANRRERRRALRQLADRSRERVFGTSDRGEASSRLEDFNRRGRGEALTPLQSYQANLVQNRVLPNLPQIELPKLVPMLDNTVTNLGTAVDSLVKLVEQKLSTPNNVTIATPINNYFPASTNPKDIADASTQATRKELYGLGLELKKA